jgi:Txe/YoeB family toxin of Txe-Axe toxin-antitoxin module
VNSEINFADDKLKKLLEKLRYSKTEDRELYKWITRALKDLENDAFSGTQISKRLIPKVYQTNFKVDNLWKYDLPKAWRLLYTIKRDQVNVISIILEWMSHKEYEIRFRY